MMSKISSKIKDIELLNLISLTYGTIFEDFRDERPLQTLDFNLSDDYVSLKSDKIFLNYKENGNIVFPKLLNDWTFLKSAKNKEAYLLKYDSIQDISLRLKMLTNISEIDSSNDGFFGVAFKNEKYREIVIVFRGTNDLIDVGTDLKLGLFKSFSRQILEANEFFNYIQRTYNNKMEYKITITGHSLGGYLAQFVHAINTLGMNVICTTFNALGLGNEETDLDSLISGALRMSAVAMDMNLSLELTRALKDLFLVENKVSNRVMTMEDDSRNIIKSLYSKVLSSYNGVHNVIEKDSSIFKNLKIAFGFGKKEDKFESNLNTEISDYQADEILTILQVIFKYQQYFYKMIEFEGFDNNCINHIFPLDFTANVRPHIGYINNITTKSSYISARIYKYNHLLSSDIKVFNNHSLYNFILYIYNSGYLTSGLIRYGFLSNIFLMYIYQKMDMLKTLCKSDLDVELIRLQNELYKDTKFLSQFHMKDYYLKGMQNVTPYYIQKDSYIFGVNQNIVYDSIKSSKPIQIKFKENQNEKRN